MAVMILYLLGGYNEKRDRSDWKVSEESFSFVTAFQKISTSARKQNHLPDVPW